VLQNAAQYAILWTNLKKGGSLMATKTANVNVRVEQDIKDQAEAILDQVGVSVSSFINMAYRQVILHRGIPFSVTIPARPKGLDEMTEAEFDEMMRVSLAQAKAGQTIPIDEAFDKLLQGQ
jgi:addiction module RelB/DinJ family antitoxin